MTQEENIKNGKVIQVQNHMARVQVEHALTCSGADPGCPYNAMYFGVTTSRILEVEAENLVGAGVGDWVKLALPARQVTQAVLWVYGSALILFFVGIIIGTFLAKWLSLNSELTMTFTSVVFLIVAVLLIRKLDKRYRPHYRIIQIMSATDFQRKNLHPGLHR